MAATAKVVLLAVVDARDAMAAMRLLRWLDVDGAGGGILIRDWLCDADTLLVLLVV